MQSSEILFDQLMRDEILYDQLLHRLELSQHASSKFAVGQCAWECDSLRASVLGSENVMII